MNNKKMYIGWAIEVIVPLVILSLLEATTEYFILVLAVVAVSIIKSYLSSKKSAGEKIVEEKIIYKNADTPPSVTVNLSGVEIELEQLLKIGKEANNKVRMIQTEQEKLEKVFLSLKNEINSLTSLDLSKTNKNSNSRITKINQQNQEFSQNIKDVEETTQFMEDGNGERKQFIDALKTKVETISTESGHSVKALSQVLNAVDKVESDISGFMEYTTETIELVKKGRNLFLQTAEYIHQIKQGLTGSAEIIRTLNQKSIEIGQIVNVIENISDKTKLLALNAKIMAAQAGVNGRGFSVVADEMTSLSENTIRSTKDIEALISSLQHEAKIILNALQEDIKRVNAGVAYSDKASDALTDIYRASINSKKMTKKIKGSIRDQEKYSGKIKDDFTKMDDVVQNVTKFVLDGVAKESDFNLNLDNVFGSIKSMIDRAQNNQKNLVDFMDYLNKIRESFETINSLPEVKLADLSTEIEDLTRDVQTMDESIEKIKQMVSN